ncbi:hypothetical protein RJ640_008247 [Escallonia rubra]|uniref:Protein kinase domain-containing protein n=1 Tax=Escallonia rubra TaxID=112253 RepID=A0AA88QFE0_9ASTE|nr:hypothetical protein RJ640_008247 [Escallonia rubra]
MRGLPTHLSFVFLLITSTTITLVHSKTDARDVVLASSVVSALNVMYSSLSSPSQLAGWKSSGGDPCGQSWKGIKCSGSSVTEIDLSGLGLTGSMGYQLSSLTSVTNFDMSKNNLKGDIPYQLPPNARHIDLSGNGFTGGVPYSVSQMKDLKYLNLGHNQLKGQLSDMFGQLSKLTELDVQNNQFSGSVNVLAALPLDDLNISNNQFTGWIPNELKNIDNIQTGGNSWSSGPAPPPPPGQKITPRASKHSSKGTEKSGLGGAAIAGIVLGVLVVLGMIIALLARKRSSPPSHYLEEDRLSQRRPFTPLASQELSNDRRSEMHKDFRVEGASGQRMPEVSLVVDWRLENFVELSFNLPYGDIPLPVYIRIKVLTSPLVLTCFAPETPDVCLPAFLKSDSAPVPSHIQFLYCPAAALFYWQFRDFFILPFSMFVCLQNSHWTVTDETLYWLTELKSFDSSSSISVKNLQSLPSMTVKPLQTYPSIGLKPPPSERIKSFSDNEFAQHMNVKRSSSIRVACYSLADLQAATGNFATGRLLGEGSLGRVYRAKCSDGKVLAAKKIDSTLFHGSREGEFPEIVANISKLHHQNIAELVGYCSDQGQNMLIYEYFRNGSLHEFLHMSDDFSKPLTWNTRVRIALGTARAVEYLHEVCSPSCVHKNIKSSNILLDIELNPRLSDCGLATFHQRTSQNLGTGYNAPECIKPSAYTLKSDVYSFGVVMLELLTGRMPFDSSKPRFEQSLVRWAAPQLHDIDALAKMVDPALRGLYPPKSLSRFADVIALCVQLEPEFRPPVSEVVQALVRLVQRSGMNQRGDDLSASRRSDDCDY